MKNKNIVQEFKERAASLEDFFGQMEKIHQEAVQREQIEEEKVSDNVAQVIAFSVSLLIGTCSFVWLVNHV